MAHIATGEKLTAPKLERKRRGWLGITTAFPAMGAGCARFV
jgi:hypothetical protein